MNSVFLKETIDSEIRTSKLSCYSGDKEAAREGNFLGKRASGKKC